MFFTADIRNSFLKFFERQEHKILCSSPLIPHHDPSLLFANSGMVPFKNYFIGQEKPPFARITTAQKCVRAGGKHNDLENVGHTARHHTFFEMLGNFSFGDYFKEEAIFYAWTLLTKEFCISPDRLYITVHSSDEEAATMWKKISGFRDDKIIRISTNDNFWSMGDTGPCGPCSEIFYDHGPHIHGGLPGTANQDGDRFVEIWNLVFMQFEQHKDGSKTALPKPCIDTGMGIERVACVLQGVHNNYDTDILKALVEGVAEKTHSDALSPEQLVSQRVLADHVRSSSFLIADGVFPSNEGRGYVLRRIIRRAVRHAHFLGTKDPLIYQLVPILVQKMGVAYPELLNAQEVIQATLKLEEERFGQTLDRGLKILEDTIPLYQKNHIFPGDVAFKLYDTFGFPLDLTQDVLKPHQMNVDVEKFTEVMTEQKERARLSWTGSGEASTDILWFDVIGIHGPTEFLGYQLEKAECQLLCFVKNDKFVNELHENDVGYMVSNQTPFYAESGGQVGDTGKVSGHHGVAEVTNTFKRVGGLFVHEVRVTEGYFRLGESAEFVVDVGRRQKLRCNHSATHLLHAALRRHLGAHVTQKGSLVGPHRLRFDFNMPQAIDKKTLLLIENEINAQIRRNVSVLTVVTTPQEAMQSGAQALFGEKYGEEVRVVSMGENFHEAYSKELCGGTHVGRTGDIGLFKILSESSVSSGVRRIEAVTGIGALDHVHELENILQQTSGFLKTSLKHLPERVHQLIEEKKNLEKKNIVFSDSGEKSSFVETYYEGNHNPLLHVHSSDNKDISLKPMMDELKKKLKSGVILITSIRGNKITALVGVTQNLLSSLDARVLIEKVSYSLDSKGGGGRPDLAQCGGSNSSLIDQAVKNLLSLL